MGGVNQSSCPTPSVGSTLSVGSGSIRFHENVGSGEVHFHDDVAGLKCAIDSASFFDKYHKWRSSMSGELSLMGHDGSGGHSSVKMIPYFDGKGELQVSMDVKRASVGGSVLDLDKLAHYP